MADIQVPSGSFSELDGFPTELRTRGDLGPVANGQVSTARAVAKLELAAQHMACRRRPPAMTCTPGGGFLAVTQAAAPVIFTLARLHREWYTQVVKAYIMYSTSSNLVTPLFALRSSYDSLWVEEQGPGSTLARKINAELVIIDKIISGDHAVSDLGTVDLDLRINYTGTPVGGTIYLYSVSLFWQPEEVITI
jgi:hypothetical protein